MFITVITCIRRNQYYGWAIDPDNRRSTILPKHGSFSSFEIACLRYPNLDVKCPQEILDKEEVKILLLKRVYMYNVHVHSE